MAIIEQLFETLLEGSSKFKEILLSIEKLMKNMAQLAETIFNLSNTIKSHHEAINDLTLAYQVIIKFMNPLGEDIFNIEDSELN